MLKEDGRNNVLEQERALTYIRGILADTEGGAEEIIKEAIDEVRKLRISFFDSAGFMKKLDTMPKPTEISSNVWIPFREQLRQEFGVMLGETAEICESASNDPEKLEVLILKLLKEGRATKSGIKNMPGLKEVLRRV